LWGQVSDSDIRQILSENTDAQHACTELVAAANRAGGIDNVSAIVVHIPA
jgi:PPM family protein phosphatase